MTMRIENHIHILHIKLYYFERCWNAALSFSDLNKLFDDGTINKSQVERWFKKFKSGDTKLKKGKSSSIKFWRTGTSANRGRKRKLDNQHVGRRLQCGPIDHRSSSQKARKNMKIDELYENYKAERVRIFNHLLQRNKQSPFLKNLTGGEAWLLFKNVKRKKVYTQRNTGRRPLEATTRYGDEARQWANTLFTK